MQSRRRLNCQPHSSPIVRETSVCDRAIDCTECGERRPQWGPVARETVVNVTSANDNIVRDERAITVSAAAERLGCDETTIRELLRKKFLAGVRVGKTANPRGVRVKIWSIEAWEEKHAIGGTCGLDIAERRVHRRRSMRNAADIEADTRLKALGA
jgi:excisionase family DNA binding protein